MIRLFIDDDLNQNAQIALSVFQTHYLCHVMRQKEGAEVVCFNGRDGEWSAHLGYVKKKAFLHVQKQIRRQINLSECILCPALIKKEAMDFVWQKATELGVTHIYPILAERTVVHKFNLEHAKSVMIEACEQCERMDIPQIMPPNDLSETLKKLKGKACIIWMSERGQGADFDCTQTPAFFVGPEGGWSEKEQQILKQNADFEWHLGQTILRAETASLSALAVYQAKKK